MFPLECIRKKMKEKGYTVMSVEINEINKDLTKTDAG